MCNNRCALNSVFGMIICTIYDMRIYFMVQQLIRILQNGEGVAGGFTRRARKICRFIVSRIE